MSAPRDCPSNILNPIEKPGHIWPYTYTTDQNRPCAACLCLCCSTKLTAGASHASRKLLSDGCAAAFHQCGGETCPANGSTCGDTAYACCPLGYGCQRLTQLYWQCLPNTDKPGILNILLNSIAHCHKRCQCRTWQQFTASALPTCSFIYKLFCGYRISAASKWGSANCIQSFQQSSRTGSGQAYRAARLPDSTG